MKTYTTPSNAKRASKSLASKYAFIVTASWAPLTESPEGGYVPFITVDCEKASIPAELFEVAIINPVDPEAWEFAEKLASSKEQNELPEQNDCRQPIIGEFHHCPHCNIDLMNGYQTYDNLREDAGMPVGGMKFQYVCLACDGEFGPEVVIEPEAPKVPAKTIVKLHKSEIDKPCKRVWAIAEAMLVSRPKAKRAEVLAACTAEGIAYYTARTQYQQWLGIRKEMAVREAQQQAKK